MRSFVIYSDESIANGTHFSNFYGGVLVEEKLIDSINAVLNAKKAELNLHQEVKFGKITENYQDKYIELVRCFFSFIQAGQIKVRIMFTQNDRTAVLTSEQQLSGYLLLYYQMLKHSFGLTHTDAAPLRLSLRCDKLPVRVSDVAAFRDYLVRLGGHSGAFGSKQVFIHHDDIAEIDSRKHVILQCLDIVLGAMQAKLNDNFNAMPPGHHRRGKKTKAKEAVYKAIFAEIKLLYPGYSFNAGVTTAVRKDASFAGKPLTGIGILNLQIPSRILLTNRRIKMGWAQIGYAFKRGSNGI